MNVVGKSKYGQIIYNPNDTNFGIRLTRYGEYLEAQSELFKKLIKPEDWITEIGSGYGYHTLLFSLLANEGVVMSFEPNRIPYYCLCGTMALNGVENVYCCQEYFSYKTGSIKIPEFNQNMPQDFCAIKDIPENTNVCTLRMKKLNDLLHTTVDFVKISSGHSVEVIGGGHEFLQTNKPFLYITTGDFGYANLFSDLKKLGYDLYGHMPRQYNPSNIANNSFNPSSNGVDHNLLAVHPKSKNIDLFNSLDKDLYDLVPVEDSYDPVEKSITEDMQIAKKEMENSIVKIMCLYSQRLYDHEKANDCVDAALKVAPESVVLMKAKAAVLIREDRWREAIDLTKIAIEKASGSKKHALCLECGTFCAYIDEHEESKDFYIKANQLKNTKNSEWHLAMAYLKLGEYEKGWELYESRVKTSRFVKWANVWSGMKYWKGESLQGKTIVLFNEQGAGDYIQMMRYFPKLKEMGATVKLVIRSELMRLDEHADFVIPCEESKIPDTYSPNEDYHCSVFSLPRILGILKTGPYITKFKEEKLPGGKNIGLVWAGSPRHENDFSRSCYLRQMKPLQFSSDLNFYSLQEGESKRTWRSEGKVDLLDKSDFKFIERPEFEDYADTAKFISKLDYVVAVDTSIAHLAAAMGKPVYMACGLGSDWRWEIDSKTTYWYPTMKIFRRTLDKTWGKVFSEIANELKYDIEKANQKEIR
jgi:FkbM family methyltransferase